MSKASLKKALKGVDREGLVDLICELYDARPEAKEYLEFWTDPNAEAELEKYKTRIFKLFFMSEGKIRKSPDFTKLKTLLKYFSTLFIDSEKNADLRLFALEIYRQWLSLRNRVMSHTTRADKMLQDTKDYITANGLEDEFALRFDRVLDEINAVFDRGDIPDRRGWRRFLKY